MSTRLLAMLSVGVGVIAAACGKGDASYAPLGPSGSGGASVSTSGGTGGRGGSSGHGSGGSSAHASSSGSGSGVASGGTGGSPVGPAVPAHAPSGVAFSDLDPATGVIGGKIRVARASDESDIASYALYYGSSATTKLTLATIATVPALGVDPVVRLPYGTALPSGATHILVFSVNATGEDPTPVATPLHDATVHWAPLATGKAATYPHVLFDAASQRLRVVGEDGSTKFPVVLDCGLDGSSCAYRGGVSTLSPNTDTGFSATGLLDTTNQRLLIVTDCDNYAVTPNRSDVSQLFRCNLDGTSCTTVELSAGLTAGRGAAPSPVIDSAHGKLLAVSDDLSAGGGTHVPALFYCNLDGSSCVYRNLTLGNGAGQISGMTPSAVIDGVSQKLLVVTNDGSRSNKPSLFTCDLDGTGCGYADISAGHGASAGTAPSAVVDAAGKRLLAVTQDGANMNKLALFLCHLDGTSCVYVDISAGQGASSGISPFALVDAANQSLVVVADDGASSDTIALVRCDLDGTGCHYSDISTGRARSGYHPTAALGPAGELFIVTEDAYTYNGTTSLFYIQ